MAKKEFTDITIEICEKRLHFNRVTNETLTKWAEQAETEYNETVKGFIDEVNVLDDKRQLLEKQISIKNKQVEIIESKEDTTDEELDKVLGILEDIEHLEDEVDTIKVRLVEMGDDNPTKAYMKRVDELLAEKVEILLDGITAKEFLKQSTPVDTIIAQNLEKYYQLCIVGEREAKIEQEIKEDVNNFLKSQRES